MLKFLDNRTHEKPAKSPKKYEPEMLYGISAQAPQNFQTPFTIVHKSTYVNPYLPFEENRKKSLPLPKHKFQPGWTKKTNLQLIEEQKIISSQFLKENQKEVSPHSRYRQTYYDQLNKNKTGRFKLIRGEFTDFIQKNNHYKSIGPLHGDERKQTRIQETKKSVWLKPDLTKTSMISKNFTVSAHSSNLTLSKSIKWEKNSTPYSTYFDQMRNSIGSSNQLVQTNTSMSKNSKLLSEKARIRNNREESNHTFERDLNERKKKSPYHKKFQLPKLNSEILMSSPKKIIPSHEYSNQLRQLQKKKTQETGMENLDEFETKILKKFKAK